MLKRTLIAIAVVALMASSVHALGPDPTYKGGNTNGGTLKVDPLKMDVLWPMEYKALDICVMPVRMEMGIFVQVKECHKRKIELKQVDCGDIGKETKHFPCYSDCEGVEIRTNFPITLGTRLVKESSVIKNWKAYYKDGDTNSDTINVDYTGGSWKKVTVCVDAWEAQLLNEEIPGGTAKINVGKLAVTVKPNV